MRIKSIILTFVKSLSLENLELIYNDYDNGLYDHLLPFSHKDLSILQQRNILVKYLERFIIEGDYENDERPETLTNIVIKNDIGKLINIIANDHFYSEPLFRTISIIK